MEGLCLTPWFHHYHLDRTIWSLELITAIQDSTIQQRPLCGEYVQSLILTEADLHAFTHADLHAFTLSTPEDPEVLWHRPFDHTTG